MGDFILKPIASLRPKAGLSAGSAVGAYRVVREIGRGGMSVVYLAERSDTFEKQVAIKVLKRGMDSDEIVQRFANERQILADFEHPNIARLLDGGTTSDGLPYFVMEYVEGDPIDRYCAVNRLSLEERLEIFRAVCSAVHFAHQHLVVHRDLKPTNVLITEAGAPKLLDFGIAKILRSDPSAEPTRTLAELRLMTPMYASPEQVQGLPISTASDVYSLGVLLYRLLAGCSPYEAAGREDGNLAQLISEVEPKKPSAAVAERDKAPRHDDGGSDPEAESDEHVRDVRALESRLAGDLDNIVLMAMRKEPERRYASAAELAEDIRRHLAKLPVAAHQDSIVYRAKKLIRRHTWGAMAVAAVGLLIVSFTAVLFWQLRRTAVERDRAEQLLDFSVELAESLDPVRSDPDSPDREDILKKIAELARSGFADQPRDQALLHDRIGRIYSSLGLYKEAAPMLEQALEIRRQVLTGDDALVAESLQNLALLRLRTGDTQAAEPLLRDALEIEHLHYGDAHPALARGLNDLATILQTRGELGQAEELFRRALELKRQLHGDEHVDIVTGLNNLGVVLLLQRRPIEAEPFLRQALELGARILGEGHPRLGKYLQNLAVSLEQQGDWHEAELLHRQALALKRQRLGDEHPSVGLGLNNLAFCLQAQEDHAQAESLYRQALAILRQRLGDSHQNVAIVERNLASFLVLRGEATAAEELARRALASLEKNDVPAWRIADVRSVLGHSLLAQKRFAEAEPLLVETYPTIRDEQGAASKHARDAEARIVELYRVWETSSSIFKDRN